MSRGSACFTYLGKIRGQGRPRFTKSGITYEAAADRKYKNAIRSAYLSQVGGFSFGSSPICVLIETHRSMPKSRPKRITSEPDTFKPDADNIAKAVLDALNGVAFDDDAQIVELITIKYKRERTYKDQDFLKVTMWNAYQTDERDNNGRN